MCGFYFLYMDDKIILENNKEITVKRSRGKRGTRKNTTKVKPQYLNPETGVFAFPASFGPSFAEQIRKRFAEKNEARP